MNIDTQLPMALYKANVQLWMNMGQLLNQSRQQWAEFGDKTMDEDMRGALDTLETLADAEGWKDFSDLPAATAQRTMKKQADTLQAGAETAMAEQARFASGMQQALASWQQATMRAFMDAGTRVPLGGSPSHSAGSAMPDFTAFMQMFTPPGSAAPTAGSRKKR